MTPEANLGWGADRARATSHLEALSVVGVDGLAQLLDGFWVGSHTSAVLMVHGGEIVYEWEARPGALTQVLPCFSITKSIVGVVAGVLMERGDLDPDRGVVTYLPELEKGGYRGVTVRDLLDMRTGGDYRESYEPGGELAQLALTQAQAPGALFSSVYDMVCGAERLGVHDGPFAYRSLDTEALGLIIERASGVPISDLVDEMVLGPLGCEGATFARDVNGQAAPSGGLSMRSIDVARCGVMMLNSGAIGDHQVVSPLFVKDLRAGHPCDADVEKEGSYRNQFWVPKRGGRELLALGIHGQMLWMDAATDTVFVKLSAWPTPSDPPLLSATYAVAQACATALDEGPPRDIAVPH